MTVYTTPWTIPAGAIEYLAEHGIVVRRPENVASVYHTHPVSAILRNHFEDVLLKPHLGRRIKSVGGNDVRHKARHKDYNIHSCCPLLSGLDVIREVKRATARRGDHCHSIFQVCEVPAEVYLFSHSMYYISKADLVDIPGGSFVLASHHVYPGPGTYCFGEMRVTGTPSMWTVQTRGNDHPYTHPQVWLTSECVISTGVNVIAFTKIAQVDTACAFSGVVTACSLCHLIDPQPIDYRRPVTELMKYIRTEASGVSITTKLVHTLQLRARSWCTAKEIPIPDDIDEQVSAAINMGMESTLRTWSSIDMVRMEQVNTLVEGIKQVEEKHTIWQRAGKLLWNVTKTASGFVTQVLAYTYPTSVPTLKQLYNHTSARVTGGIRKFLTQYVLAKQKTARWYQSQWFAVPTSIPANVPENELTSIFTRSLPPTKPVRIDPKIRGAAMILAQQIGKLETPMTLDDWLTRFPPVRRKQLAQAHDQPLSATVEFFQKIEQLDEPKQPRAIQARVDSFKAHLGPWIAQFELLCRQRLPIFVKGMDGKAKAETIDRLRERSLWALEIDFSRFDRSLSTELLQATEHLIYQHCLPPAIARAMSLQLRNHVKTRNNASYTVDGTRMSGDVNTSLGNCLVVASLMLAQGLPLNSFVVEGDDMIASITERERLRLCPTMLADAGLEPKIRIIPQEESEFCSRRLIHTMHGPRLCRDPRREIRRVGYSIHGETERDKLLRGAQEWAGIPMMGPLYESALGTPITPISDITRGEFAQVWGIDHDAQVRFETDPIFRHEYAVEIASPDSPATGDSHSALQGVTRSRPERDETVPLCPRQFRTTPPGRERAHVRDVPPSRSGESSVSSSCGDHIQRGSAYRRRLRRKRQRANIPGNRGAVAQEHDPSVERQHSSCTAQSGDETKVVGDGQ